MHSNSYLSTQISPTIWSIRKLKLWNNKGTLIQQLIYLVDCNFSNSTNCKVYEVSGKLFELVDFPITFRTITRHITRQGASEHNLTAHLLYISRGNRDLVWLYVIKNSLLAIYQGLRRKRICSHAQQYD